jgi:hypothetical protein
VTLVTSRMTCGLHFVKTYGSKSIKTLKSLPKIRGDYLCRGVRRHALPDELSAHGGARVLLGERDRVNGLAHHPGDRMVTHVHSVVMRCGRQGRLECGTGLPTPYGQPQPKTHGGLFRRQGRCRPRMRLRKVDVGPVLSGMPQMRRVVGRIPSITPVTPRAGQLRRPSRHISRPVAGAIWVPNPAVRTLRQAACAPFARARGGGTRSRHRTVSPSPKPTPPSAHAQPTPRDMAPQGADPDASGGYTTGAFFAAKEGAARACGCERST